MPTEAKGECLLPRASSSSIYVVRLGDTRGIFEKVNLMLQNGFNYYCTTCIFESQ